jgi:4-hydroxy-tetrahydrodipicolinate reductase
MALSGIAGSDVSTGRMVMRDTIGVIQYGMGPIGQMVTRTLAGRQVLQLRGAVDIDPAKVGRDVGEVAGLDTRLGVIVSNDADGVLRDPSSSVVLHTTGSSLVGVKPQLEQILRAKKCVVSTTEELAYPRYHHADIADELDRLARENGVAIVGTGVNPGFAMDLLPLTLSSIVTDVKRIHVKRYQDASERRLPFRKKIGAGMTPEEFHRHAASGVIRHVGLAESICLIAHSLGWKLDRITDEIEPILAETSVSMPDMEVSAGQVAGCRQFGRGYMGDTECILLEMSMFVGAPESFDTVIIEGSRTVESTVKGGIHGDVATISRAVQTVPVIVKVPPGLYTVTELPTVSATVI